MRSFTLSVAHLTVTPFAGVWIEIDMGKNAYLFNTVTPFAGVWIEMRVSCVFHMVCAVTPFAGVWIEIMSVCTSGLFPKSLPLRECGLKCMKH